MKTRLTEIEGMESAGLFRVLSSDTRRGILRRLQDGPRSVGGLAQDLGLSRSSITRHIQDLTDAGLISSDSENGERGLQRMCRLRCERVTVRFDHGTSLQPRVEEKEMPFGLYTRAELERPCGLASETGLIGSIDDPQSFLLPERASAQLLWLGHGFVEYVFPNRLQAGSQIHRLELAMEICSELALHRIDCPGDVTVWINGQEVGTWTSFGGLGEGRGRLTPEWWWDTRTQYGMLKVWSVDAAGAFVDGSPVSGCTLDDLRIMPQEPITVRIGIRPDTMNSGSLILFGRRFGNYEQDLVLRLHYENEMTSAD